MCSVQRAASISSTSFNALTRTWQRLRLTGTYLPTYIVIAAKFPSPNPAACAMREVYKVTSNCNFNQCSVDAFPGQNSSESIAYASDGRFIYAPIHPSHPAQLVGAHASSVDCSRGTSLFDWTQS